MKNRWRSFLFAFASGAMVVCFAEAIARHAYHDAITDALLAVAFFAWFLGAEKDA